MKKIDLETVLDFIRNCNAQELAAVDCAVVARKKVLRKDAFEVMKRFMSVDELKSFADDLDNMLL